jgi:ribosomal protein S18 acetylase RimI-like enzyme
MITIRLAAPADASSLADLNQPAQDLHAAHRPDSFKPFNQPQTADWFRTMLENPDVQAWIAESDSVPVAYALTITHDRSENPFRRARRFTEIDQLAVVPAFRRQGIARALVGRVLEEARAHQIPEVELSSWLFNTIAQEAFRKLGFTPETVRFRRPNS